MSLRFKVPDFDNHPVPKTFEERDLSDFPLPYDEKCSPLTDKHFPYKVRTACQNITASKNEILRLTKVIVVGDVAVGKTCIVKRFCLQTFETNYKATIGVDYDSEKFYILGVPYVLQLWDTAGQEKFQCIASSYYRGARVVVLVFDFSQIATLYNIPKWLDETKKCIDDPPMLFLVGSKMDIVTQSALKITEGEAIKLANTIGAEYCPVSAKTGMNVDLLFKRIAVVTFCENIAKESTAVHEALKISESFVKSSKSKKKKSKCVSGCGK